jgi:hypothetical protein
MVARPLTALTPLKSTAWMSQAVSDRHSGFKSSNLRNDQRKRDQTLTRSSVHQCRSARRFLCPQFRRPIFGEFSKKVNYSIAVENGPRNFKSFYHEIAAWNSVINDRDTQRQSYLWYYRPNGNFRSFSPWGHANYQNTSISTPFRRQVTEFSVLSPIYRMTSHPVRRRHAGIGTSNRIRIRS